jgi:endonuclease G
MAAYDRKNRHPAWVSCCGTYETDKQTAEHLTAQSLSRTPPPSAPGAHPVPLETARAADTVKADRSKSTFMEDNEIPEVFRAKLNDCAL